MSRKKSLESQSEDLESMIERSANEPIPKWHLKLIDERLARLKGQRDRFKTRREFRSELVQERAALAKERSRKSTGSSPLDDLESWKEVTDDEPVPEWHLKILADRMAKYGDSTEGFMTLEDFWAQFSLKQR